ncbi:hypothetical protein PG999_002079 [Apiospora kogelbergensis]|uniref:Uncharacterized protein n=1 Tax=Apiospora kogelbergensis TaxID=1337665 RepID=A0AAW0R775_9PEZI
MRNYLALKHKAAQTWKLPSRGVVMAASVTPSARSLAVSQWCCSASGLDADTWSLVKSKLTRNDVTKAASSTTLSERLAGHCVKHRNSQNTKIRSGRRVQ